MHVLIAASVLSALPTPSFEDAVQSKLDDISFTVKVVSSSRAELRKINKDFAAGYEAESARVQYKDPLKIKITSSVNGQSVVYIVNGGRKSYHVPRLRLKTRDDDVTKEPGKWQTLLDFGMVTPGMRASFLSGTFVRADRSGDFIFDARYQYPQDKTRHRIWVDPAKRYITKRMWYNQRGELMATFVFELPVESNGVWFPSKLTVFNAEGKVAGVSRFLDVKANTGIPDSVFKL